VVDTTIPVLTLTGVNPQIIDVNTPYLELGATASDNYDLDITDNILINTLAVDLTTVGSYLVTYNVLDSSGNAAVALTRTVFVLEHGKPWAKDDVSSPFVYNSKDNLVDVLANDSFGIDGAIDKGLTMVNGTSSNASTNGGAIRVERNNTLDTMDDLIIYSAPKDFSGVDTFKYTITDATGHASTGIATITVSEQRTDVPTALKDAFPVISDTETLLNVLSNDIFGTDGAGSLSLNGASTSTAGFAISIDVGATAGALDDTVKYFPTGGFTGTDSFTYTITDANGDTATAIVTLTVRSAKPVNGKPIAVDDLITPAIVYNSIENSIAVLPNDNFGTDGASTTHSLRLLKGRRSSISANKGVIRLADDVILYSAPRDFTGEDTFQYVITDASGDASTGTVTLTVAPEVLTPGPVADFISVDKNSIDNLIDVVANDNLGATGVGRMLIMSTSHLTAPTAQGGVINLFDNGTPADATDDKILYTPATNFTGIDTFAYYLEVDGVEYTNGSVTITVNSVASVHNTPTAVDDFVTAPVAYNSKDTTIDVLANDDFGSDGAIDKGLTMVNGTSSNASANGGEIRVERNNTLNTMDDVIIYSAPKDFSGVDTFKYTITDLSGEASTATATITVSVQRTDLPIAEQDSFDVISGRETLLTVLGNDNFGTDGEGILSLNGVTTSLEGFAISIDLGATLAISDNKVSYTATGGFIGTDSFSYTITDANGDTATAIVRLRVAAPANTKPTANDDVVTVVINSVNNIFNVTLNDDYGAEGQNATHALRLRNGKSSTESTKGGKISVDDGNILYSPPTDFDGTDSFIYTITDLSGDASTATVTIKVAAAKTETTNDGQEQITKNEFLVYPNPSNGYVKTTVFSTINTTATISLFDVTGKVIYSSVEQITTGKNEVDFNVNVKAGVLFLRVLSKEVNFGTSKIVFK
ncbi:Ig-like domain-containing protein, partial [Polaribacter glomeratus]|uniref:Ig-like domain-containing protein n=1 Tax=Polaribacter glomeratus TaxID=102 RepID=UPI0011BE2DDB